MDEYTDISRLAITDILTPKFVLTVICALASKIVWQENDTVAKAAEEVLRAYRDINTNIEELKHEKVPTASGTLLFDKNVATDSSLSPIDKAVYSVLCTLADKKTLQCSPKVKIIAEKASCSESAVRKSLATLAKHKVIKRKFRYINHRQISSLYTVIRAEVETITSCEENIQTHTHSNTTPVEAEKNSAVEDVGNITEPTPAYFIGNTEERAIGHHEDSDNGQHHEEGEKTLLESFKDSIRGASLPALAEKDLDEPDTIIPEEVTPTEETKASLTGGALLPILEEKKTKNPETPESVSSTSDKTEKTPFIKAECDGTTMTDNAVTTLQENTLVRPETTLDAPMANVAPTTGEAPASELSEALRREYEQLRAEYTRDEKSTVETKSVASLLDDVLADIVIKADSGEVATPENPSAQEREAPVIETEATNTCEHSNPTDTGENPADSPVPEAEPADIPAPKKANPADELPAQEMESDTPVKPAEPKETGRKKPGKSSGGGSPKDRYSPDYAPEVMRPTAEYLLYKTGRKGLRWEEIEILRELSAIHYPTVVNKEIRRACERFEKRNQPLECLTLMYIAVGLRKWRSYGKKKKKELSEEKKKYFAQYEPKKKTEEEKAAILAELRELEASL